MIDQRSQNNVFAGAVYSGSLESDMEAFDQLPAALRRVVCENSTKLASFTVLRHAHNLVAYGIPPADAVRATIGEIRRLEEGEISVFAGRYLSEYRQPLPHTAARATVQRYGALATRRNCSRFPRRS